MSNETPNTPGLSETELRGMKVDELRDRRVTPAWRAPRR